MAIKSVVDQAFLRESNLSSVLRFLHSEVSISRAQLAALTGLNKSTISSLVEELLERGLVHEIGINSVGAGRPAMLLEINPEAGSIIGVELGVDFIFVVITDFVGKIIWRRLAQADPAEEKETTLAQTLEIVNEAIKAGRELGLRPLGLGLATPGIVNLNEGVLVFAPNLHWRDVPLCKIFSEETG
ncbi:MAG: ROK family protein, partial [Anaerolineales bacterium]|nr:ROK family protein [Anaerolineales bacterium]